MKKLLPIILLGLFISCGSVTNYYPKENIYDDKLNESKKSELGDKLALHAEGYFYDAIKIKSIESFKIKTLDFPYKNGDILPLLSHNKNWYLYYNNSSAKEIMGIAINKNNPSIILPFFAYSFNGLNNIITKDVGKILLENSDLIDPNCKVCFKQELIFNGKVDNNLKFIYREYILDFARPSFIQEMQYDLNESKIIGFKGLRLEIIKASNTNIEYVILNPFNRLR